jgi:hypothetical protein
MYRPYSWCRKGKSNYILTDTKGKGLHLLVATTLDDIILLQIEDSPYNTDLFGRAVRKIKIKMA